MDASLENRFRAHVLERALLPERGRILVAVSGGADSMTALELVRTCLPDAVCGVAHFDHAVRETSAQDAAFVRDRAAAFGLPFFTERMHATSHAEAAWRAARYAFLGKAARAFAADAVVTAHHADDQAETVLFRIARGAGTAGLRGIPERRGRLVRPLLPFRRAELRAYAAAAGVPWREDPSNCDESHARNRIRRTLLPALDAAAPGTSERLIAVARLAAEAETHWQQELPSLLREVVIDRDAHGFTLATTVLLGYHPRIRARVLRYLCRALGSVPDRAGTRRATAFMQSARSGRHVHVTPVIRLERVFGDFRLQREDRSRPDNSAKDVGNTLCIPSPTPGSSMVRLGGRNLRVHWGFEEGEDCANAVAFNPAELCFPLAVRGWVPGDQIRLSYGSKKLKKLFAERRIARPQRRQVPVLAEGTGAILWLAGIARAAVPAPENGPTTFRIRIEE
jgi:tRNA(Ile)-lysidine synthase